MTKKTYTKEQKQAYFSSLRERWQEIKRLADAEDNNGAAKVAFREAVSAGLTASFFSFLFTWKQMQRVGLSGLPYIDAKTFKGWRDNGFSVKKGEKAFLTGISWVEVGKKDDANDDDGYMLPKEYKLFHRSQVVEM